jgi:MOSC domain-containing protein YiiM
MKIAFLNVGRPQIVVFEDHRYSTAIRRKSSAESIELTPRGLLGDRVADSRHHGSADQALCVYSLENYALVGEFVGRKLEIPSFGENLTTLGTLETQVCIGDIFQIAVARVQITQPRQPCATLARNLLNSDVIEWIARTGRSGFYLRVLSPGTLHADDSIELVDRPQPSMPVADVLIQRYLATPDADRLREWIAVPELADGYRQVLRRRLKIDSLPED